MKTTISALIVAAGMSLLFVGTGWALVPPPPVNQEIGFLDVRITSLEEADCRFCHDVADAVPDRHHLLYGQPIPDGSLVPYPDPDGDGVEDTIYTCFNCHDENFTVVRDCVTCHTRSPHHVTAIALGGDCVACHGDLVDNMDDGHYIPTYSPSLITPARSDGSGEPLNSRGNGAGACNYCHDDDGLAEPVILSNRSLHHGTGLAGAGKCGFCHDFSLPFEEQIRTCEGCHGPEALHNIQADSPNPDNPGTIVVGGEDAGYGHVGRDAGAGDSDCWGCHGFGAATAPYTGPIIPTVYGSDSPVIDAGTDTAVTLAGASFSNVTDLTLYLSDVALTAADGSGVVLTPDQEDQGSLSVTIPGDLAPGNYDVRAVKADVASNPTVISIIPEVSIAKATGAGRTVTIDGSGFGGYAEGSGTSVTGTVTTGWGANQTTTTVEAAIVSWSDTTIKAQFGAGPSDVTVASVFGSASSEVERPVLGGGGGGCGIGFELALLVPPLMWLRRRRRVLDM
jgi:hypothetical protein